MPTLGQIYSPQAAAEEAEMASPKSPEAAATATSQRDENVTAMVTPTDKASSTVFNFEVTPPPDAASPMLPILPDVVPKSYRRRLRHHRGSLIHQPSR
jgi:hypothetical protein